MNQKSAAQIAYETFSASLDIQEQLGKGGKVIRGPVAWESLPQGDRDRWKLVADSVKERLEK